jgi:Mannose-1-phosphate guanylyltransferase
MNIVLLSGGSGKRLWPLSDDVKSKQFLKLLKNESGDYESMIQRIHRQIKESGVIVKNIIVAANEKQKDLIHEQIGYDVDIVTEPERRNTFPAIMLSCAYLALEKKCSDYEVVIVMPVDPYVEIDYFTTFIRMYDSVKLNSSELVLMGIKPTYPSEKYGYIVPALGEIDEPKKVASFKEKPSVEAATELIRAGAMWNGGVFAFKLGFALTYIKDYKAACSYKDIYSSYSKFSKNSFDYEVVEKCASISVVSYEGIWKDLGTWNILTEEMNENAIGNVTKDEETHNTHIINELEIPIVALGLKDVVIVAGENGILISKKSKSENLKKHVT